ncbi:MAG TPA: ester cyclase [Longimicrobiales bacterium]|nr:ester cyclase [Longimicrobiales bacterium]
MTEKDVIKLLRHNIEAFNDGDFEAFGSTLAETGSFEELATRRVNRSRDDEIALSRGWRKAFPDARGTIKNIFASGDQAVAEIVWEGTHDGDLEGPEGKIPATHKRIAVQASMVVRVKDGKIAESHHYFDMQTLLGQLQA